MNPLKKLPYLSLISMFLLIQACKKNKTKKEDPSQEKPDAKIFVPIKFETGKLTIDLRYKENSNLLTEIKSSDGNRIAIAYSNDQQPAKLEKFKNDELYYVVFYEKDNRQMITRATLFDYDDLSGSYTPSGFYSLGYNDNKQAVEVKYHNVQNQPDRLYSRSYHSSGNLDNVAVRNFPDLTTTLNYAFDDKKGIVSNVSHSWLFALESEHWFLSCAINNLLGYSNAKMPAEQTSFSYEYNEEAYPSKMQVTRNKTVQNINISYKEILP